MYMCLLVERHVYALNCQNSCRRRDVVRRWRSKPEGARRVLNAAVKGSIDILERENDDILKTARCNSGEKMSGAALTTHKRQVQW